MEQSLPSPVNEIPTRAVVKALSETYTQAEAALLLNVSPGYLTLCSRKSGEVERAIRDQRDRQECRLASAIQECNGNLSKVADLVGMETPAAVRYHVMRNPRLRALWEGCRERVVDQAEENVFGAVQAGDLKMSWKLLQTLGKGRGYTERREIDARVLHQTDSLPTAKLVEMLDGAAEVQPEVLEAEYSILGEDDRRLLRQALSREVVGR